MEDLCISDYLNLLRRRAKLFGLVALALFALGAGLAFSWSNYRSKATIEVAQPDILTSYTDTQSSKGPSLENLVDLHISRIQQKVLSTASLIEIITKLDLYPEQRRAVPMAELAERMRGKIKVQLVGSALANPASAQKASADQLAAIAFTISFDADAPALAQRTLGELVSRFLDEDARQRRSKAQDTNAFLDSQLKALEATLAEQEKKIADFRAQNGDIRPEALAFNQQTVLSTQMSLQSLEAQIASNLGTQGALRAQLAATDPYSRVLSEGRLLTTPSSQLKALKSEQASLTARYGAAHPDVLKINRQVAALESQGTAGGGASSLQSSIEDTNARLQVARSRYGAQNPDVVRLERQLDGLREAARNKANIQEPDLVQDADNPAYLQIVAQMRSASEQGRALGAQREELTRQLAKYRSAVVQNPAAEQHLAALARDYDNGQLRYRELKANKLAAAMNETIEQDRSGQRLAIINPPDLPLKTQPARLLFLAGAFVFALGGGLGAVLLAQLASGSLIGAGQLEALAGAPPLVIVPHIETREEKRTRLKKYAKLLAALAVGGIVLLIAVSYVVMPLDVLGTVLMRRLGLY